MSAPEDTTENVESQEPGAAEAVINDPNLLARLQDVDFDLKTKAYAEYRKLPAVVKRRVKALKNLQLEGFKIESAFFRRMNDLEREFESKYTELYEKRHKIIAGEVEPTDKECEWTFDDEEDDEPVTEETDAAGDTKNGISDFWLTIFKNVPMLLEHKDESDDALLAHLSDIKCKIHDENQRPGFQLEFIFTPNDFMSDTSLKKDYFIRFDPSDTDPLSYEGPEITETKGTVIHWKPNKDLTVRVVKKTVKGKKGGEKKTVSKTMKTNSFFNFFSPPKGCIDSLDEDADEEVIAEMQSDFELGQFIREQLIPRSVLFFTGEGIEDEEEYDSEGLEEEDMDEDDDENESGNQRKRNRNSGSNQKDCKQQ